MTNGEKTHNRIGVATGIAIAVILQSQADPGKPPYALAALAALYVFAALWALFRGAPKP